MESSITLDTKPFTKVDTVIVRVAFLERARKWYEANLGLEAGFVDLENSPILRLDLELFPSPRLLNVEA